MARRIERGDLAAKEKLVTANLGLAIAVARKYEHRGAPLADLVQDGILGLIRATEKFDWRRGYRFSTYATKWIRRFLEDGLAIGVPGLALPRTFAADAHQVQVTELALQQRLRRAPEVRELAEALGSTPERIAAIRRAATPVRSLDEPSGDERPPLEHTLVDGCEGVPEAVMRRENRRVLKRALQRLGEEQRAALELLYGLRGHPRTEAEVCRELEVDLGELKRLCCGALAALGSDTDLLALAA